MQDHQKANQTIELVHQLDWHFVHMLDEDSLFPICSVYLLVVLLRGNDVLTLCVLTLKMEHKDKERKACHWHEDLQWYR